MLTQYLADFAISTQASSIPESAREVARLSLLDWLAVGIAGCEEPVSNIVREMLAAEGGVAESTVFGQQIKLPARAAALANGTISHALDYDDTHFIYLGHPSVAVFPAAFAVAEKVGAGFEDFLDAALLGMESTCRIGAWLGREHYERGFHQTATAGSFGSTLAACRLLGLDVEQTCFALGQTASRASGLKAQFGTMGKPFHAGMAASNGVEAASLAQAGFVSCASAMEAEQGFAETHSVDFNDVAVALNGLGSSWVFETVQHKFHACCHGTHASLEAIGEMQGQTDLPGDSIDRVSITVHPSYLKVCNIAEPVTGLEAKFSLRFTGAMMLSGWDTASLDQFSSDACQNTELVSLRDKIKVNTDQELTETQAKVTITTFDGSVLSASHDLDNPMSTEIRQQKVCHKAAALIGGQHQGNIWQNIIAPDADSMNVLATTVANSN